MYHMLTLVLVGLLLTVIIGLFIFLFGGIHGGIGVLLGMLVASVIAFIIVKYYIVDPYNRSISEDFPNRDKLTCLDLSKPESVLKCYLNKENKTHHLVISYFENLSKSYMKEVDPRRRDKIYKKLRELVNTYTTSDSYVPLEVKDKTPQLIKLEEERLSNIRHFQDELVDRLYHFENKKQGYDEEINKQTKGKQHVANAA